MNRRQPPMPADEAQEYLRKLQTGKLKLPEDATALEREAFEAVKECSQQVRELTTQRQDLEKQIEGMSQQLRVLGSQIDSAGGELGGYARLLVSAEGARRKEANPPAQEQKPPGEVVAKVDLDEMLAKEDTVEEVTEPPKDSDPENEAPEKEEAPVKGSNGSAKKRKLLRDRPQVT